MSIAPFVLLHMQREQKKRDEASSEERLRREAVHREVSARIALSPVNYLPANMAVHCDVVPFTGGSCESGMGAGLPPLVE